MSNLYILSCGAQVEDAGFNLASSANQVPFSLPHNIPSKKNVRGKWHFLFIFVCWCTEYITLLFTSSGSLSLHFPFSFIPSVLSSIFFPFSFPLCLLLSSVPFPILARCRRHRRNLISTISAPSHIEAHTVKNAHTPTQCLISALPPRFSSPYKKDMHCRKGHIISTQTNDETLF